MAVASTPAFTLSQNALRTAGRATPPRTSDVVQWWIGNVCTLDLSKAKSTMTNERDNQEEHHEPHEDARAPRETGELHSASNAPAKLASSR